ncbi:MAG: hypothetical protein LBO78_01050 [Rickettsiales bacterium]|jgi:hypothetical protein|nr:hypothetical protein [Rickettsiales bacterium]
MRTVGFFLLLIGAVVAPAAAMAEEGIDYDKPYDQIQEQIRTQQSAEPAGGFSDRHSLMPKDFGAGGLIMPAGSEPASTADSASAAPPATPAADKAKILEPAKPDEQAKQIDPVEPAIKAEEANAEEPTSGAVSSAPAAASPAPAAAEAGTGAPVVLREVHMDKLEMPTEYIESGNTLVPAPKIRIVDERAGEMTNLPLFPKDRPAIGNDMQGRQNPPATHDAAAFAPGRPSEAGVPDSSDMQHPQPAPLRRREMLSGTLMPKVKPVPAELKSSAHVASYNTEESAVKGIDVLAKKYPLAGRLSARISLEDVPDKGYFYRLYFEGDRRDVERLCKEMKAGADWCSVQK